MPAAKPNPVFKIIKSEHKTQLNYTHKLYLDGKMLSNKLYVWRTGVIYIDDFIRFSISKISKMKSKDFPKGFRFSFSTVKPLELVFDMITIERRRNAFRISMYGGMDLDSTDGLIWHPRRFIEVVGKLGAAKGYKVETNYEPHLLIYMNIKFEKTIGEVFRKAYSQLHELIAEANTEMWKLAKSANEIPR